MPETLYLIDGHAQIFRAYYAIRGGMRSPVTSEPTHAVFGFTAMLIKLLSQLTPHYVVAIDMPGKTAMTCSTIRRGRGRRCRTT